METTLVQLVFPHQLFKPAPFPLTDAPIYLIEEHLFFTQYAFHKQKIAFHRASMKAYQNELEINGATVHYIEAHQPQHDIRVLIAELSKKAFNRSESSIQPIPI